MINHLCDLRLIVRKLVFIWLFIFFFAGVIPLATAGENPGEDIQTYTVKTGEHLYGIAQKFDVSLSDLRSANNIEGNIIRPGQELIIPTDVPPDSPDSADRQMEQAESNPPEAAPSPDNEVNNLISLDMREADLRDVLTALALKMDVQILLVEAPGEVSFQVSDVTPQRAFQLLLQQEGLSYISDNKLYIVGQDGTLESDFFHNMVLTRFNLNYIPASSLEGVVGQLGIPLQSITLAENERSMWVQATPLSLAKVRQVISALDRPENADPEEIIALELKRYNLEYITAEVLDGMAADLGINLQSIVLDTNPHTIWVQGVPDSLNKLERLMAEVDIQENSEIDQPLNRFNLQHITASKLETLAEGLDVSMRSFFLETNPQTLWVQAVPQALQKLEDLVSAVDRPENAEGVFSVFVYQLENTVADDVVERLGVFGFEGVETVTYNYSQFTQEVLVVSPSHLESKVYSAIAKLDEVRQRVRVPVASASGEGARSRLVAQRELLSELTGVSISRMNISSNLSGDSADPYYLLWIEESPDKVQKVENMVGMIGEISGP